MKPYLPQKSPLLCPQTLGAHRPLRRTGQLAAPMPWYGTPCECWPERVSPPVTSSPERGGMEQWSQPQTWKAEDQSSHPSHSSEELSVLGCEE